MLPSRSAALCQHSESGEVVLPCSRCAESDREVCDCGEPVAAHVGEKCPKRDTYLMPVNRWEPGYEGHGYWGKE